MMNITYANFSELLRTAVPGFDRVYDEHIADNNEVLPHVLLGDLVRFLSSEVESRGESSDALKPAMLLLEQGMGSSDPLLQELVAVSFIENLERREPSFPVIRKLFGPKLEEQYRTYEAFRQR